MARKRAARWIVSGEDRKGKSVFESYNCEADAEGRMREINRQGGFVHVVRIDGGHGDAQPHRTVKGE